MHGYPFLVVLIALTIKQWRNLTPKQYFALIAAIVYVHSGVTILVNSMTSQMNTIVTWKTFMQECVNEPEIVLKSTDQRLNIKFVLINKGFIMNIWRCW